MKNIMTIIKKELARFFKDARLVITTLLFPGLMIFGIYSIMGDAMGNMLSGDPDYVPIVKVVNMPDSINALISANEIEVEIQDLTLAEIEQAKTSIIDKDTDLLLIFPLDFDSLVDEALNNGGLAPEISMYYNSTKPESSSVYYLFATLFDGYEMSLSNIITLNGDVEEAYDLASDQDTLGMVLSMILPFLILSLLFSGCLAVTPESIAGEKERGTIATLLVTPIKRHELAVGKIISLSILASLAALSSFTGTILSLPKIIGMQGGETADALSNFLITDYLAIIFVIVSIVLFIVSFLAILSAYARSVKEANALAMPFMIMTLLVGILTMFGGGSSLNLALYLIPIYGPTQALVGIFSFATDWTHIALAGISSIFYAALCGLLLIRMFNSERVMFKR
ncbi:MAG TPA: ABC transporter permease subunit [Bacilli bacterium]|nr:ABC transporter permease subunit [Bacilli bacterium]